MIAALIAQDLRATRKTLGTTIGIALLVSAVSLTLTALRVPVLGSIGLVVAIIAGAGLSVAVLGVLVEHYWRTMYGREGYFTMTIPVRGRTLFTAKVLFGLAAAIVAVVVTTAVLLGAAVALAIADRVEPFEYLRTSFGMVEPWIAWFAVAALLLQVVYLVIVGASVMSIGAQARFNHLGFGAPVLGSVIVYLVMQVVTFVGIMFVPLGLVMTGPDAGEIVARGMLPELIAAVRNGPTSGTDPGQAPEVLGLGFVFTSVAAAAILAWWGARAVDRHTSLR